MENNLLYVVSKAYCECFNVCKPDKAEETIQRAKEFYKQGVKTYKSHLVNYPDMSDQWNTQLKRCERTLKEGFEAIGWDEYLKRQRLQWLSKSAKEVTEEQWEEALCVLPPTGWHQDENASYFFMSERLTMTFTSQYYHDRKRDKYYTAVVDMCDKNTWIDKLLNQ